MKDEIFIDNHCWPNSALTTLTGRKIRLLKQFLKCYLAFDVYKMFSQSPVNHSLLLASSAHKIFGLQDQRKETPCRAVTLQMPCGGASY